MEELARLLAVAFDFAMGYFFYRTISCIMRPRKPVILRILAWLLCVMIPSVVIQPMDSVNITVILLLFLGMNFLLFEGKWYVKLSVVMLLYPICTAVNFLNYNLGTILFFTFTDGSQLLNAWFSSLSEGLLLLFWLLFYRLTRERFSRISELLDQRSWLFLDIICLASLTAVFSLTVFTPSIQPWAYPCMLACIVTNFGSIYLASYLADTILADMERKNLRLQKDYYEELEKNQLTIRRMRHDMNNHFAVLEGMVEKGETAGALEYMEQLTGHMASGNRPFCKNSIINTVLNAKYNLAVEKQIDCFFHISIDGIMSIDDISLCAIFANTLDNAIEACVKVAEPSARKISVKARYTENGYFSYEIVNSKANPIRKKKGVLLTDKEDSRSHGLGLSSVRAAVEKYHGTLDISYTEEEFRLVVLMSA